MHRRQALVGFHTWCEDWSNASCPRDEAACTAQLEVRGWLSVRMHVGRRWAA